MAATAVILNDLEGHSPVAGVIKCNPSNICAAFYTISTDSVLVRSLCISTASCYFFHVKCTLFEGCSCEIGNRKYTKLWICANIHLSVFSTGSVLY